MTDSITVTREQVEWTFKHWLINNSPVLHIGAYDDDFRSRLMKSFTTALFNNVKVGEEGEMPRRHDPAQYDRLVEAFEGVMAEREELRTKVKTFREALVDIGENGTRHDLNPTVSINLACGHSEISRGWVTYIKEMDDVVRNRAKIALADTHRGEQ